MLKKSSRKKKSLLREKLTKSIAFQHLKRKSSRKPFVFLLIALSYLSRIFGALHVAPTPDIYFPKTRKKDKKRNKKRTNMKNCFTFIH